ncbi:MAG: HIT domain-containing protein, partial [Bryobacteraceae bacterium]|nr:HIT domain-containing protein [Bryobacteraceae bacterium]
YVSKSGKDDGCVFCVKPAQEQDEENLILHRGRLSFVLMNLYPYSTGHLMVAPYAHVATLEDAAEELAAELMELTRRSQRHLREVYNAPGYNIGMNIGESAGAGVAGHIHMHVLPRWPGDASFMTTVAETRVIPEDLGTTWRKLRDAFASS